MIVPRVTDFAVLRCDWERAEQGRPDDRTLALSEKGDDADYCMMSPERPTGTVQKLFLSGLSVFANFAINMPEAVSTSAAS